MRYCFIGVAGILHFFYRVYFYEFYFFLIKNDQIFNQKLFLFLFGSILKRKIFYVLIIKILLKFKLLTNNKINENLTQISIIILLLFKYLLIRI